MLSNGDEWGWQAKFFLEPPGNGEWQQIDDSVKTALEKHPRLTRYFVCLPINRPDARVPGRQSFMDKWDAHVAKWGSWARAKQISVEFEYWGEYEIASRLSQDRHRGRSFFWFQKEVLDQKWFKDRVSEATANAGPRYTPEVNVELPIATLFEGLGRTKKFFTNITALRGRLVREYAKLRRSLQVDAGAEPFKTLIEGIESFRSAVKKAEEVNAEESLDLTGLTQSASDLRDRAFDCAEKAREFHGAEKKGAVSKGLENSGVTGPAVRSDRYGYVVHHIYEVAGVLREFLETFEGAAARLANVAALLLIGEAGTGKTHLFCDIAKQRTREGEPTLLLLGEQFSSAEPWVQIIQLLGLTCDGREELLGALEAAAQARGERGLILIDGLNEGEGKNLWQKHLAGVLLVLRRFPRIGIAISVRSSYLDVVIPDGLGEDKLVRQSQHGFAGHEYEATKTFFDYFGIERPAVPILSPEFQNPLFLKIFCTGIRNRRLTRIPPGLRGITGIFDFFLDSVNDKLAQPERLDYDKSEMLVQKGVATFSEVLARKGATWLAADEARSLINALLPREGHEGSLYRQLISEGVFSIDRFPSGQGSEREEGIRFSYERLTDHSVTRILLERHLSRDNPAKSFSPNSRLGRFVKDERAAWMNGGIVEALCVQLPELTGKELPEVAPLCADFDRVREGLVQSLIFRDPKAIGKGTRQYVNNHILRFRDSADAFWDALLTVAPVPEHPFNADFLHENLMRYALAERDAWWSIYLHRQYGEKNAVDRLVEWAWSREDKKHIQDESIRLSAVALAWFLTTSNRYLRDRATKALVALLTPRIRVLRKVLAMFLKVNDPYVLERLCAVAYGCAMRSEDVAGVAGLAKDVFSWFFESGSPPPDILLRDCARGVVEVALNSGSDIGIEERLVRPPYKSVWPQKIPSNAELEEYRKWSNDMPDVEWARLEIYESVMGFGDFARYIIGTNWGGFNWSSRRLGSRRKPSRKEILGRFIKSLNQNQRKRLRSYAVLQQRLAHIEFERLAGSEVAQEAATGNSTDEELRTSVLSAEAGFIESLGKSQRSKYEKFIRHYLTRSNPEEEEGRFDLSIAQRWIFKKVLDLGWTTERFGKFDRQINLYPHRGREATKPERIGKKYQWIAYHEFLARVADNFEFKGESWSDKTIPYEGPWQAFIRDIDPSCLVAKTKRQDWRPHSKTWWFPSSYDAWDLEADDMKWIKSSKDLPPANPLLEVERPEDHSRWLVMEAYYNWEQPTPPEEERFEVPRRSIWYMLRTYIVKRTDTRKVFNWASRRDFWGRWMPESKELYRVFLGEFHWAPAYKYFNTPYHGQSWRARGEGCVIPAEILPTASFYVEGGSGYDCSIDEGIYIHVPCRWLAEGMKMCWKGVDGSYFGENGDLLAFDPSVNEVGPGALLINKDRLLAFLRDEGYDMFWTVLGEKDLIGGRDYPGSWKGRLIVNGAFRIKHNSVKGALRTRFDGPR
ncbi:MAG TPA: AVAST type 2 anti-phage system protein Avs2 [Terriglobia bacterium]|nr:AVAST type 2 anti-phage system protein Avs2 [Terriglobia bacterium]